MRVYPTSEHSRLVRYYSFMTAYEASYRSTQNYRTSDMGKRFSIEAVFKAVDKITAPVTRMQNRVGKFTRMAGRGFDKVKRRVDKLVSGIGRVGIAVGAATAVMVKGLSHVVGVGAQFEQSLVNAAAKFPGEIRKGTEAFKALEDAARETGKTTEFTASQSAEALNFLAMAGFNAESAIAALPGVVDLATAANVDLATATDVASDSLGAFGLMTKDASQLGLNLARVNDVIAKTTTTANTTVETMFETIKDGAPVATAAGASIETFAALTGELANAGIKGSKAGTTLKNMFLSLSAPTNTAAKVLSRLGVKTVDSQGDMMDIVDILDDLGGSLDGLGTAQRAGVLESIFGKIPIAGVNVLLDSGADKLKEYRKQLEGSTGASSKMANVMRDTVQGRLNSLNSAIEGVKISLFTMNSGPLADTIDGMTLWVRENENMIAQNISATITTLIPLVGALAKAFVSVGTAIGETAARTTIFFGKMNESILELTTPEGAMDAAKTVGETFLDTILRPLDVLGVTSTLNALGITKPKTVTPAAPSVLDDRGIPLGNDDRRGDVFIGEHDVPSMVPPQDRMTNNTQTNSAEVLIRDETGRAEIVGNNKSNNGITLQPSGAF
jgi:TP901 family phage tail tape measure protein